MKRSKVSTAANDSDEDDENLWELKPKKWSLKIAIKNDKKQSGSASQPSGSDSNKTQAKSKATNARKRVSVKTKLTTSTKNATLESKTPLRKNEGHCPNCQMPFSILRIESPRWHVTECMDLPISTPLGQ